jgi:hypothetical protein
MFETCKKLVEASWSMGFMWWRSARGERGGSSFLEPIQPRVQTIWRQNFSTGIADALFLADTDQSSNNMEKEFLSRNYRCFVSSWYRPLLGRVSEKR